MADQVTAAAISAQAAGAGLPRGRMDKVNRHAFSSRGARAYFDSLTGWVDPGEAALIGAALDRQPRPRVLDIGIGTGRTIPLLTPHSARFTGIDMAPRLLARARARHPGLDLRLMDARRLDCPDASFELVAFSYNGLDAVGFADRETILAEVRRVLVPGGIFAFSSLNRDGPGYREPFRLPRPRPGRSWLGEFPRVAAKTIVGVWNKTRNSRFAVDRPDVAIAISSAHNYGVPAVFISVPAQTAQLGRHGLTTLAAWSQSGEALALDRPSPAATWIHYLAQAVA